MIKKFAVVLAALAMMLGGAVGSASAAEPIRAAATINGCDPDSICLYDWINTNYASGFWQRDLFQDVGSQSDGGVARCMNLNDQKWHDLVGSPNNTASSLIFNGGGGTQTVYVVLRENLCGGGGAELIYQASTSGTVIEPNLAASSKDPQCYSYTCQWNWYDRISSIRYYITG